MNFAILIKNNKVYKPQEHIIFKIREKRKMEKNKKDVSDKIVLVLLIIAIFVSVFCTWTSINSVNNYAEKFSPTKQIQSSLGGQNNDATSQTLKVGHAFVNLEILSQPS